MRKRLGDGMSRPQLVGGMALAGSWVAMGLPPGRGPYPAAAQGRSRSTAIGVNVGYGLRVEDAGAVAEGAGLLERRQQCQGDGGFAGTTVGAGDDQSRTMHRSCAHARLTTFPRT